MLLPVDTLVQLVAADSKLFVSGGAENKSTGGSKGPTSEGTNPRTRGRGSGSHVGRGLRPSRRRRTAIRPSSKPLCSTLRSNSSIAPAVRRLLVTIRLWLLVFPFSELQ